MTVRQTILVVVDPTATSHPAVDKGARLARELQLSLRLLICDHTPALGARHVSDDALRADATERVRGQHVAKLDAIAAPLLAQGLDVATEVRLGGPLHTAIMNRVAELEPAFVVKDTHYHAVIRRTLLTNTDWHLIRECAVPLLLVRPAPWNAAHLRVVAAIDPGHSDDASHALEHSILRVTSRLRRASGASVGAVHVFAALRGLKVAPAQNDEWGFGRGALAGLVQEMRVTRRGEFDRLLEGFDVAPAERHFLDGDVIDTLPLFVAEQNADILVLGAVARSRAFELFVGSTAERLLDRLPCDVLIVKASPA